MANVLTPTARQQFLGGDTAWDSDTFKAMLTDADYTFSAAHDFLNDVAGAGRVATSAALSGKGITNGYATAANPTFSAVASGTTVTGLWVFKDTGVESTSTLVAWYDTKADSTAISVVTNGGDITVQWHASGLFRV